MLNVFVGVFNMFPLLPLDGGHAAIATYERLRERNGQRYHADVSKMMPFAMAVITDATVPLRRRPVPRHHPAGGSTWRSPSWTTERRPTEQISVGNVLVGGGAPITVQSMTITKTADVEGTLQQIYGLAAAGCDIVRCTCNEQKPPRASLRSCCARRSR